MAFKRYLARHLYPSTATNRAADDLTSHRQDGAMSGRSLKVAGAYASSWVAGVGPVEPDTEVADHA